MLKETSKETLKERLKETSIGRLVLLILIVFIIGLPLSIRIVFSAQEEKHKVYVKPWSEQSVYSMPVDLEKFQRIVVNDVTFPGFMENLVYFDRSIKELSMNEDGTKFAIIFQQFNLKKVHYLEPSKTLLKTFSLYGGYDSMPVMTANGAIYFVSERFGNKEIYNADYQAFVNDPENYLIKRVVDNLSDNYFPSVNSDGTKLAYVSDKDEGRKLIYVRDLQTGEESIPSYYWNLNSSPKLSADGNHLVYETIKVEDANREVYLVDLREKVNYNVSSHAAVDINPSVSGDGTRVVFQSKRGNGSTFDVYMYDKNNSVFYNISRNPKTEDVKPTISADGNIIVYQSQFQWGWTSIHYLDLTAKLDIHFWKKGTHIILRSSQYVSQTANVVVLDIGGVLYRVDVQQALRPRLENAANGANNNTTPAAPQPQ